MRDIKAINSAHPPFHGGRLHQAAEQFGLPIDHWVDLSTGINPHSYPLPAVPQNVWQKLPDDGDNLLNIAAGYYGSDHLLAVAGSQVAIEYLPVIRKTIRPALKSGSRVAILSPAYAEYAYQWKRQGHVVEELTADQIEARLDVKLEERLRSLDVVIVIRPNNPTTEFLSQERLHRWLKVLQQNNGWLIIDEAFIDAQPANKDLSMIRKEPVRGLIVLRSVGKFFGLAGIRLGFVWAEPALLVGLGTMLAAWSISSVARWAGAIALQDSAWQLQMRVVLSADSQRLAELLMKKAQPQIQQRSFFCLSTPLFCTVDLRKSRKGLAVELYQQFARQGILIRYFEKTPALRFGLPANEAAWQRLESSLLELKR